MVVNEHTLYALIKGPGKVPPARVALRRDQYEGTGDRKTTYEREKPSGAIFPLEIVRLVTDPTTLRGWIWERDTIDAAWVIAKNEKIEIRGRYITRI